MASPAASGGAPKKRVSAATAWREARELIRTHRHRLLLGSGLMLINRAAGAVLPGTSGYLIDDVLHRGRGDLLGPLAGAIAAATVLQAGTAFALAQVLGVAAQRAINDLRRAVHDHVLRLPVRFFDGAPSGQLISRIMTDAEGVRNLVGNGIVQLVGGVITGLIALAVLLWLDWTLTLAVIGVLAVFGGGMALAFTRLRPLFRERGRLNAEVTGRLGEALAGVRVVKAYVAEDRERAVFAGGVARLFDIIRRAITGTSLASAASTVVIGVIALLMVLSAGRSVIDGTMTTGHLVMYLLFVGLLAAPVVQIAAIGTQISEAFAGLDRIRELRGQRTEDADDAGRQPCPAIDGAVEFDAVTFAYDPGRPVLHDIAFAAASGSTTALVGPSGSGKSTLVSLIMAFNRPTAGAVRIDGRDLATLRLRDYRAQLGIVLQDTILFDDTVTGNIAYAKPGATDEEVRAAARLANCDDFVAGFPLGYATVVGERGIKLSGGQRQRIAIARALLAQPRILILDEATSALDSESEALIQEGLQRLRHGRTTFVIAHRLSTIRSADQILVIDGGRIVERGTHDDLVARTGGRYRQLHERQHRVERDRVVPLDAGL